VSVHSDGQAALPFVDDPLDDEPDDDEAAAGFALPDSLPAVLAGLSDGASDFLASPLAVSVPAGRR